MFNKNHSVSSSRSSASMSGGIAMRGSSDFDGNDFLQNVQKLLEVQQEKFSKILDERLEKIVNKVESLEGIITDRKSVCADDISERSASLSQESLYYKRSNSFSSLYANSGRPSGPLTEESLKKHANKRPESSVGSSPTTQGDGGNRSGIRSPVISDSDSVVSVLSCLTPKTTHLAMPWTDMDQEYMKPLSEKMEKELDSIDNIAKYATSEMVDMR